MKIKRRYPNYFSGFEETEHDVSSKEELLQIDWIAELLKIPNHMGMFCSPSTMRIKYSETFETAPDLLMSLKKGDNDKVIYFVVGYIYGDGKELGLEDYNNFI